jgi:hypothetical protein
MPMFSLLDSQNRKGTTKPSQMTMRSACIIAHAACGFVRGKVLYCSAAQPSKHT